MSLCVLTTTPPERGISDRSGVEVRPLPKPRRPREAIADAFDRGADTVVLADVPLHGDELDRGLEALFESDAIVWLDPARILRALIPRALAPAPGLGGRDPLAAAHAVAVALRRHTWDALRPAPRCRAARAALVELAVRTERAGLEVGYLDAVASSGRPVGSHRQVLRGLFAGFRREG